MTQNIKKFPSMFIFGKVGELLLVILSQMIQKMWMMKLSQMIREMWNHQ